jgi:hypothetical protein
MEYVIPVIPTAGQIEEMTPDEKAAKQAELEAVMLREAQSYQEWEKKRIERQAAFDTAYSAWKEQNQALFENLDEAKNEARLSHNFLQEAAVARRLLTGDRTWKAFQAAELREARFDDAAMLAWVLNEAPGSLRSRLVTLKVKEVASLLISRADEFGVPKEYEGAAPIPALVVKTYTGKVLAKELSALIEPVPVKMIEAVGEPVTIHVPDPIRLLTQDAVMKAADGLDTLLEATERDLQRIAATPVPEPIPATYKGDDIPF